MINYSLLREEYRPSEIEILLVGEAPPPNGKKYFYLPVAMSENREIELDASLPATIFYHYFKKRPASIEEYTSMLENLKEMGIFLVDLIDDPIQIRGNKQNEAYLVRQIPTFRGRLLSMGIDVPENNWIFLLARNSYASRLIAAYPDAQRIPWKKFRMM